ncbi:alkaline phosphatase [Bacillus massiliigorillae]|uniref:alkaline phosphatase n=1 Tax=Bacillus massiliigorillae TaxID=1243664 RepID=UPI00039D0C5A|nr:alkaline phosphatase [Bacillus massiliigorillae]
MKTKVFIVVLAGIMAFSGFVFTKEEPENVEAKAVVVKPTNVIMMIMDGTSIDTLTLSRWYKGERLALDALASGAVRTYSAESAISDSAPAATAMATGYKSNDKYVGVLPSIVTSPNVPKVDEHDKMKPIANILEGAKRLGKATGIVATSEIQHATPAAFSSHTIHRENYSDIAEQQVYQGMDVILGGGKASLLPGEHNRARKDGENLVKVINDKGYDFVENKEALMSSKSNKIWGAFAYDSLPYHIDRVEKTKEPTLSDMTKKAIQVLSRDRDGFFLMVEGSKGDWAAHNNDPIGMISETLAFEAAVQEAVAFAKKDAHTLVVAVADHGNSGIRMGNRDTSTSYPFTPVADYIAPLREAKRSLEGALQDLNENRSNIEFVAAQYGLTNLTVAELNSLKKATNLKKQMVQMLAQRAHLGFTTNGHTGEDVILYSYGPGRPTGTIENIDIARVLSQYMGVSLDELNEEMFMDANALFRGRGYVTEVDHSNPHNIVFKATKENINIEIPQNKNVLSKNGQLHVLKDVSVYNGKGFYVSNEALEVAEK